MAKSHNQQSLELHKRNRGKIEVNSKIKLDRKNLSMAYTPGVAAVSKLLAKSPEKTSKYTIKGNCVAMISDGSAVLGLGNVGPYSAIPVMEGKAAIFKNFAKVDVFPICLETQDIDDIVDIVRNIAPVFGGINLEDIAAPRCFEIERKLKKVLDIPVFHDDQHGTSIVVLAGLLNALSVVKKDIEKIKIVISGSGAAGIAILKILKLKGARNIVMLDSKGVINEKRKDLPPHKKALLKHLLSDNSIKEALTDSDVFIGVSKGNVMKPRDVRAMRKDPIIFALANPIPEIMPDIALKAGAKIVATGRSDYPNQLNNALVFPGFFRGLLDSKSKEVTDKMKLEAAESLSKIVRKPSVKSIIPSIFNNNVVQQISKAVIKSAGKSS